MCSLSVFVFVVAPLVTFKSGIFRSFESEQPLTCEEGNFLMMQGEREVKAKLYTVEVEKGFLNHRILLGLPKKILMTPILLCCR